jgi:dolichol kinase
MTHEIQNINGNGNGNEKENINNHFIALIVVGMQNLSASIIGYKLLKHTFILLLEHKLIETTIATICVAILSISFYKLYILINHTFELLVEHKRVTTIKIQEQDAIITKLQDIIERQRVVLNDMGRYVPLTHT